MASNRNSPTLYCMGGDAYAKLKLASYGAGGEEVGLFYLNRLIDLINHTRG